MFVLFALLFSLTCRAENDPDKSESYGEHYGYTFDVKSERERRSIEMVMLDKPKDLPPPSSAKIVDDKLTKEFQAQYRNRFGQTEAQELINSPGRSDEYTYYNTQNPVGIQQYTAYQRQFGEYMGRRLVEYHFDNWAKSDPTFKPIYELKDRVSNLDVKVKNGYKLKWKYNFAGSNMEATLENPYDVIVKVRLDMSGVISAPTEVWYSLGYQLTPKINVTALYKQIDGIYQLVFTRKVTSHFSTSLTGSVDTLPAGPVVQQNLVLVGFIWSE